MPELRETATTPTAEERVGSKMAAIAENINGAIADVDDLPATLVDLAERVCENQDEQNEVFGELHRLCCEKLGI